LQKRKLVYISTIISIIVIVIIDIVTYWYYS